MRLLLAILLVSLLGLVPLLADTAAEDVSGQAVQFTVAHDGTGTFTYQWKKDGAPIPGATAKAYTIASVSAADAGTYTCQVTNKAGTVLSDKGVFTVIVNPTKATITIGRPTPGP